MLEIVCLIYLQCSCYNSMSRYTHPHNYGEMLFDMTMQTPPLSAFAKPSAIFFRYFEQWVAPWPINSQFRWNFHDHYALPATGNMLGAKPLCHFLYVPTFQHVARCLGLSRWDMVRSRGPFAFVIAPPMHACPIALCSVRLICLTSLGAPYGKRLFNIFVHTGPRCNSPPAAASRV